MFTQRILNIGKLGIAEPILFTPISVLVRAKRCPPSKPKDDPKSKTAKSICPPRRPPLSGVIGSDGGSKASVGKGSTPVCGGGSVSRQGKASGGSTGGAGVPLIRAMKSGKCRMGFIPEEWFQFFSTKTGVTGPYFLMLGLANYLASKEIFVMEHEYYSGLSVVLVLYLVTKKFGAQIAEALDKQVDERHALFQKDRDVDTAYFLSVIKEAELAKVRASSQKELMTAKKENIALQLEAAYRARIMKVYKAVRGRMEYHIKKNRVETYIVQTWMAEWIEMKVRESITPEFRKKALMSAIQELDALASRVK